MTDEPHAATWAGHDEESCRWVEQLRPGCQADHDGLLDVARAFGDIGSPSGCAPTDSISPP